MNKQRYGFLLIELLFYVIISLVLILITSQTLTTVINHMRREYANNFRIMHLYTACRALEYDLQSASCDKKNWIKIEQQKLQWLHENKRITWKFQNKKLNRSIGYFDAKKKQWRKESSSLLADNIMMCNFKIIYNDEQVDTITCNLSGEVSKGTIIDLEERIWPMHNRIL